MKKYVFLFSLTILGIHLFAQSKKKKAARADALHAPVSLVTQSDSLSYSIGIMVASFYKQQGNQVVMSYLEKAKAEKAAAAKKQGVTFLAENKSKPGVVTTASGLQYIVLKEGTGPKPAATDKVKCDYEGKLIDGTVFDSSTKQGHPIEFTVNGVIKGWTEALQLMNTGSKWRLFIPSDLAYGDQPMGPDIKPGSTLIFDVELVEIVK